MIRFFFIAVFCMSIASSNAQKWPDLQLKNINRESIDIGNLNHYKAVVLVWLSPECPLCKNYSLPLRKFYNEFTEDSILFVGVVAGTYFKRKEILQYIDKYKIPFDILLDDSYILTKHFKAEVTPEAILVNSKGEAIYQGAIDNWAIALGKQRRKASENYLKDAINEFLKEEPITISKTEPIGCLIYALKPTK